MARLASLASADCVGIGFVTADEALDEALAGTGTTLVEIARAEFGWTPFCVGRVAGVCSLVSVGLAKDVGRPVGVAITMGGGAAVDRGGFGVSESVFSGVDFCCGATTGAATTVAPDTGAAESFVDVTVPSFISENLVLAWSPGPAAGVKAGSLALPTTMDFWSISTAA